jgi:proteasome lid subunit RPN8/RPN11
VTEDPVCLDAIRRIAREAGLKEAVGLLYRAPGEPEIVVALENIADDAHRSYAVRTADIAAAITTIVGEADSVERLAEADVVVWHTHPSGAVGPSLQDMRTKLPGLRYAVVVILSDDAMTITEF